MARQISLEGFEGSVKVDKSSKGLIYADFKITQNGSYQVHLNKGTTMYVSVDVQPCQNCQLQAIQQEIDLTNQIVSPDIAGETSPLAGFRRPSYSESAPSTNTPATEVTMNRGFEESGEVDMDKAKLVCSDSHQSKRK